MIVLVFSLLLWGLAVWLVLLARSRADGTFEIGLEEALWDFLALLPRLAVGVIGAGFIAKALPQDVVSGWLGPESGLKGIGLATLAGALTPGGPVVGYAMGAAALKAGAGLPQVMAFVTGWALYTINRMIVWELPLMPRELVLLRVVVSLPFPFIAAFLAGFGR
ncbi:MAG: hypothetical protein ACRC7G_17045 [Beijerinckiaceae bacterium]